METPTTDLIASGYQKLGRKTLFLLISEQIAPSILIFIAAIAITVVQALGIFSKIPLLAHWSIFLVLGVWILFVLMVSITLFVTYLNYANFEFFLDADALKIRQGILSKSETAIPYRQIQNVDIEQDLSDRLWGVARLAILTAGHEEAKEGDEDSSEGILPAIDRDLAESLQTELLTRADVEKVLDEK